LLPFSAKRPLPPALARYVFSWETMHTIIGGRSALDLSHLRLVNGGTDEAYRFLARYGYDLNVPSQSDDVQRIRQLSIEFVRSVLLPGLRGVQMPAEFESMPVLDMLLLAAADPEIAAKKYPDTAHERTLRSAWACAVLRVMHTMAHAVNYFQSNYYREIRERILNRFVEQVRTHPDGSQYLHSASFDVPLVRFEVKETKPLHSVAIKLLQKQENVAYDLFDHIGVRMIVQRPVDALFAVRALREEHTIMYPNIKPTRSRNTLIEMHEYDNHVRSCLLRYQNGELDEDGTAQAIHAFDSKPETTEQVDWNPYSSDKYQSIQFTCRQMIRFANPLFERLTHAQAVAHKHLVGDPLQEMLKALSTDQIDPEIQFFFPYEVQVMDIASYEQATEGRASYAEYKERQIASVRRRVMPRVLELIGQPLETEADHAAPQAETAKKRSYSATGLLPEMSVEQMRAMVDGYRRVNGDYVPPEPT